MTTDPIVVDVPGEPQRTSGMAISSFVLGLMSFCMCIFTGVPAIVLGVMGLSRINASPGLLRGRNLAITGIILGSIGSLLFMPGILVALLLPAIQSARETARAAASANNMREIQLAMSNYEQTHRGFPAPASFDAQGKPLLSWRVHILPYLEQQALYQQFHLNEPWDSPHNKPLLAQMPKAYACPNLDDDTRTNYLLPTGPRTVFPADRPMHGNIAISDGRSVTIWLVEADADRAVPWTAPEDLPVDAANPNAGLGHLRPRSFMAGMADGSIHRIPNESDSQELMSLFDPADGAGTIRD